MTRGGISPVFPELIEDSVGKFAIPKSASRLVWRRPERDAPILYLRVVC
jgi:hypothetical protein